jgi:hypothetical protein
LQRVNFKAFRDNVLYKKEPEKLELLDDKIVKGAVKENTTTIFIKFSKFF